MTLKNVRKVGWVLKALLLCGGEGTRLRPFTYTQPKVLLPLGHQPILFHILDTLADTPIREVAVIIGNNGQPIMDLLAKRNPWGFNFSFILQPEPLGLAHTVIIARETLGDDPFLMYLGDNILDEPLRPLINRFTAEKADALVLLRRVKNPRSFGVAVIDDTRVIRVEEKPDQPQSNLALVGIYLFTPAIHQAVRTLKPSRRGELEITDGIAQLITAGKTVHYHLLSGWWKDTGTVTDLLETNHYLLRKLPPTNEGQVKKSEVSGVLAVQKGSILKNCRVKGPVAIGTGCRITGAEIGPYLSVGDGVKITNCRLSRGLILPGAQISGVNLADSIVGERVQISSRQKNDEPASLLVGADAILKL
ncbi:MAG TPA: glucose-1-phosphate thymidylyltransferase [Firmicutes bacterium]|nr:glucose-1-phosphate thymidylyltransferase [Bacillota bacterium]